jgi:hypothetical protein
MLAVLGVPTPKIARRSRMAQDAVRMLKPACTGLPRKRRGRKHLPTGTTGRPMTEACECGA